MEVKVGQVLTQLGILWWSGISPPHETSTFLPEVILWVFRRFHGVCESFSSQSLKTPSSAVGFCSSGSLLGWYIKQPHASFLTGAAQVWSLENTHTFPLPLQTVGAQAPPTQPLWFLAPLHRLGPAPPAALSKIPSHIQPFFSLLNLFSRPKIGS